MKKTPTDLVNTCQNCLFFVKNPVHMFEMLIPSFFSTLLFQHYCFLLLLFILGNNEWNLRNIMQYEAIRFMKLILRICNCFLSEIECMFPHVWEDGYFMYHFEVMYYVSYFSLIRNFFFLHVFSVCYACKANKNKRKMLYLQAKKKSTLLKYL